LGNSLTLSNGIQHFFESKSFRGVLPSMASASSRLSLPFSSSRAFKRLASETSIPPNFAFQLCGLRDPVLPRQVSRLCTRFLLPQDPGDLPFREPLPLHRPSPFSGPASKSIWRKSSVAGHTLQDISEIIEHCV
jgi:hypothetical protein